MIDDDFDPVERVTPGPEDVVNPDDVVDAGVAMPRDGESNTTEQLRVEIEATSGFLPPPSLMEKYNKVLPGFAESMVDEWHQENRHRRRMDERVVEGQFSIIRRGQFLAFGAFFVAMVLAAYLIADDKDVSGLTIMIGSIVAIVSLFLLGPSDSRPDETPPPDREPEKDDRPVPRQRR